MDPGASTGASGSATGWSTKGPSPGGPGRLCIETLLCATWRLLALPPSGTSLDFDQMVSALKTPSCPPPVAVLLVGNAAGASSPGLLGLCLFWVLVPHCPSVPAGTRAHHPSAGCLSPTPAPTSLQPPHFCRSMRRHGSWNPRAPALIPPSTLSPPRRSQLVSVL